MSCPVWTFVRFLEDCGQKNKVFLTSSRSRHTGGRDGSAFSAGILCDIILNEPGTSIRFLVRGHVCVTWCRENMQVVLNNRNVSILEYSICSFYIGITSYSTDLARRRNKNNRLGWGSSHPLPLFVNFALPRRGRPRMMPAKVHST